jgi:hypothetical protein
MILTEEQLKALEKLHLLFLIHGAEKAAKAAFHTLVSILFYFLSSFRSAKLDPLIIA